METDFSPENPRRVLEFVEDFKPRLPENEFVTKYLLTLHAYLSGSEEININYYVEGIKGTPMSRVDITAPDGTVLYEVPPVILSAPKIFNSNLTQSIGDVLTKAENANRVIPGSATKIIERELTTHVQDHTSDLQDHQKRWDTIFTKYGLTPVFGSTPTSTESNAKNEDDGEFDDYDTF